ncbi:CBN-HSP-17 protein [Aphelenchoides avenae]|nr:CBN-HSP-17 protein [Aphelenchus avenae]
MAHVRSHCHVRRHRSHSHDSSQSRSRSHSPSNRRKCAKKLHSQMKKGRFPHGAFQDPRMAMMMEFERDWPSMRRGGCRRGGHFDGDDHQGGRGHFGGPGRHGCPCHRGGRSHIGDREGLGENCGAGPAAAAVKVGNPVPDSDRYLASINVTGYTREELKTTVDAGKLVIEGRSEKTDDFGTVTRQFRRELSVPQDVPVERFVVELGADAVLRIRIAEPPQQQQAQPAAQSIPIVTVE